MSYAAPLDFKSGNIIEVEINCKEGKLTVRNTTQGLCDTQELRPVYYPIEPWRLNINAACDREFVDEDDEDTAPPRFRILDSRYIV